MFFSDDTLYGMVGFRFFQLDCVYNLFLLLTRTVRIKSTPFTEFGITLVIGQAAKEEQKREAHLYLGFLRVSILHIT